MGLIWFLRCWGFVFLLWGKVVGGLSPDGGLSTPFSLPPTERDTLVSQAGQRLNRGAALPGDNAKCPPEVILVPQALPSNLKVPTSLLGTPKAALPGAHRTLQNGAFIVTQFPGHEDCTAGAQCSGVSPDSPSFTPLTWQPKPIFAFWQQGCSSRPARKTASTKWLFWCGQSREKGQDRCAQESPQVVHLPKLLPSCKSRRVDLPQASPSPLWFHLSHGSPGGPTRPRLPRTIQVYTNHLYFWTPCVSRETAAVGHPTCHPSAGSGLLGSRLPFLYAPAPPIEALRTPSLAAFIPPTSQWDAGEGNSLPKF